MNNHLIVYNKELQKLNKIKEKIKKSDKKLLNDELHFIFGLISISGLLFLFAVSESIDFAVWTVFFGFLASFIFPKIFLSENRDRDLWYYIPELIAVWLISCVIIQIVFVFLYLSFFKDVVPSHYYSFLFSLLIESLFFFYLKWKFGSIRYSFSSLYNKEINETNEINNKIARMESIIYEELDSIELVKIAIFEHKSFNLEHANKLLHKILDIRLTKGGFSSYSEYEKELITERINKNESNKITMENT